MKYLFDFYKQALVGQHTSAQSKSIPLEKILTPSKKKKR